jgi:hypothetical protein
MAGSSDDGNDDVPMAVPLTETSLTGGPPTHVTAHDQHHNEVEHAPVPVTLITGDAFSASIA